jgi:hypothetical protein
MVEEDSGLRLASKLDQKALPNSDELPVSQRLDKNVVSAFLLPHFFLVELTLCYVQIYKDSVWN